MFIGRQYSPEAFLVARGAAQVAHGLPECPAVKGDIAQAEVYWSGSAMIASTHSRLRFWLLLRQVVGLSGTQRKSGLALSQ